MNYILIHSTSLYLCAMYCNAYLFLIFAIYQSYHRDVCAFLTSVGHKWVTADLFTNRKVLAVLLCTQQSNQDTKRNAAVSHVGHWQNQSRTAPSSDVVMCV